MHLPSAHPVERFLHRLADWIWRWPRWFVYPQIVLFLGSVLFSASFLEFRTDRNDLISEDEVYQRHWRELSEEFEVREDLVTLIESEDLEKNRQFVERLAARLEAEPQFFRSIFFKGDFQTLGDKALLLLPEERLEGILHALRVYGPLLRVFSGANDLDSLFSEVETQMRAADPDAGSRQPLATAIPALRRVIEQASDCLNRPGVPPSPGVTALFAVGRARDPGQYLSFAEGRLYVLACSGSDEESERDVIRRLRALVRETQIEVPGVNVGITGEPVLRHDEMKQAGADTALASVVALLAVALTFIYGYHEIWRPLKATASLVVGIGYTLGFATLTVGHLNILTITFVPILIGLAIDFGVHLITRFEEELRRGCTERVAVDKALVASGTGICTSGFTIAVAFFAMTLTGFKGVQEMGIISGGGLLVCLVPMMTMLPALLRSRAQEPMSGPAPARATAAAAAAATAAAGEGEGGTVRLRRERIEELWLKRPRLVAAGGGVLLLLACSQLHRVSFDYNLLNLQSQSLPAVVYERKMLESAPRSLLSGHLMADSLEEALALEARLLQLDTVDSVGSVAPLLTQDQEGKLALVREIKSEIEGLQFDPVNPAPVDLPRLYDTLANLSRTSLGAIQAVKKIQEPKLETDLRELREAIENLRIMIRYGSPEEQAETLTLYQRALFGDLSETVDALKTQDDREPLRAADLPPGLRSRFIGRTGKFLIQVYPKYDVWEREHQEQFVRELRSVDSSVTGSPVRFYEYTSKLKKSFQTAPVYALIAIAFILLINFRNVACVLLIIFPVVVGVLWTLGLMAVFGLAFNPANIIALTLLIGVGVSNGIHILNRFTEEKHPSLLAKSTGKALLVSAVTTMAGFGSLTLAKHAGIASLGQIMSIGTAMCLLSSLTILPAVLILLKRSGWTLAHGWFSTRPS